MWTSQSMDAPVWPHLSACPSPVQTRRGTELILTTITLYSYMSSNTFAPVWWPLCSQHTTLIVSWLPFSFKSLLETRGFNSYYLLYFTCSLCSVFRIFLYKTQLSVFLPSKCAGSPHWWPAGLDRPPSCLGSTWSWWWGKGGQMCSCRQTLSSLPPDPPAEPVQEGKTSPVISNRRPDISGMKPNDCSQGGSELELSIYSGVTKGYY